ncbi:hypothetical protein FJM67_15820 [Maribrevibacterium harenarium]|uniref:DNA-binding transcriptional repressor CapW winged helix-turn-helix domain-containing protein n=1 Tax=Maribrevibacterium harenarium TaxID=2589817 RepID=A0A501WLR8_9GAMM|nr:helix-turn-helix domain-containing protein [Maribrevibacterium harenarium]TPE46626.1 hypothetical protein FJM67_15820 [Maribrevibacterium harenarium]
MKDLPQYWFIELTLFWEGGINTKPLMRQFGVTRQTASQWLKHYEKDSANKLDYCSSTKSYHCESLLPRYINQSIDEYLDWCETGQFPRRHTISVLPIDRLRQVQCFVDPAIVRPLIKAMRHSGGL